MNNNLNNQPVNNQNNLTLVISTVLITVLVIALGIFGYKEFIAKDKEESNKENGNVVQPTATPTPTPVATPTNLPAVKQALNVEGDLVKGLFNNLHYAATSDNVEEMYYYTNDKILASQLSYEQKMKIMINTLINKYGKTASSGYGKEYTMSRSEFNKEYSQMFGEEFKYQYKNYKLNADSLEKVSPSKLLSDEKINATKVDVGRLSIEFSGDTVRVYSGGGDVTTFNRHSIISKAEQEGNYIYIYEVPEFYEQLQSCPTGSDDSCVNSTKIYKDPSKSQLVAEYNEWISDKDANIKSNQSKLDTYKYTFVSNGDGTYHFYSVEKVK